MKQPKAECRRKKAYTSKKQANYAMRSVGRAKKFKHYHAYKCPHCYKWHIGSLKSNDSRL